MTETGAGSNLVPRAFPFKLGREDTPRNSWRVCAARFSDLDPSAISGQNMLEWLDLRFETRPHPFSDLAWKNCFQVNTVPRPSQVFLSIVFINWYYVTRNWMFLFSWSRRDIFAYTGTPPDFRPWMREPKRLTQPCTLWRLHTYLYSL